MARSSIHFAAVAVLACVVAAIAATARAEDAATLAPTACVASYAFAGPNHASGLATAMTRLAEELTAQGVTVTLLHAGPVRHGGSAAEWQARYAADGMGYANVLDRTAAQVPVAGSLAKVRSFRLFEWLAAHAGTCGVVHVHDYRGLGYSSTSAKAAGHPALAAVAFVVQGHGNTRMMHEANGEDHTTATAMADEAMEAGSLALADMVTAPSRFYLQWLRNAGLLLPAATATATATATAARVVPNLFPAALGGMAAGMCADAAARAAPADALAFFGRQTELKGLHVFLDAAEKLCPAGEATAAACRFTKVLFVGPPATLASGERSTDVIARRCKSLSVPCEVVAGLSSTAAALERLIAERAVVVLPSLQEAAGSALVECAMAGLPVIASNAGGLTEMTTPVEGVETFFEAGSVHALASRAAAATASPCSFLATPAASRADTAAAWMAVHTEAAAVAAATATVATVATAVAAATPVTVAIIGNYDAEACLAAPLLCSTAMAGVTATAHSLAVQTQAATEVVVVASAGLASAAVAGLAQAIATLPNARVVSSAAATVAGMMNT